MQKKCLPNNFVQLKIIKSCPKRKENPLIMQKIVIFYTEIFTGKIVLWCFFSSEMSEQNPQFNFSSQNLSIECNFFK